MIKIGTRNITVRGVKLEIYPAWVGSTKRPRLGIYVKGTGQVYGTIEGSVLFDTATEKDVDRLVKKIKFANCTLPGCKNSYVVSHDTATNNPRKRCFKHRVQEEEEEAIRKDERQASQLAKSDATHIAKGFLYKAEVWIHKDGDDTYVVEYFKKKPARAKLIQIARKYRSKIWDDHAVYKLTKGTFRGISN